MNCPGDELSLLGILGGFGTIVAMMVTCYVTIWLLDKRQHNIEQGDC